MPIIKLPEGLFSPHVDLILLIAFTIITNFYYVSLYEVLKQINEGK